MVASDNASAAQPEDMYPFVGDIAGVVTDAVKDVYAKIKAEALRVCGALVVAMQGQVSCTKI